MNEPDEGGGQAAVADLKAVRERKFRQQPQQRELASERASAEVRVDGSQGVAATEQGS